jgi:hypothetical protein
MRVLFIVGKKTFCGSLKIWNFVNCNFWLFRLKRLPTPVIEQTHENYAKIDISVCSYMTYFRLSFHEFIMNAYKFEIFQKRNWKTKVNRSCIFVLTYIVARPCHSSSTQSLASLVKWNLWWTKWLWGRFLPSALVSTANFYSTKFSILTVTWGRYSRPEVVDVPSGPGLETTPPPPPNAKLKFLFFYTKS